MSSAKIFGWILLLAGLAIIVYPLYSSYSIFTAQKPAPEIFEIVEEESPQQGEGQMEEMIEEQLKGVIGKMLPADSIPKLLNLMSWSIFAGILIFGGSKISGLGIRLIRKR